MADEFAKGETVVLKSGGPVMTVKWCADRYGERVVCCNWFVGTKLHEECFAPETLQKPAPRRALRPVF